MNLLYWRIFFIYSHNFWRNRHLRIFVNRFSAKFSFSLSPSLLPLLNIYIYILYYVKPRCKLLSNIYLFCLWSSLSEARSWYGIFFKFLLMIYSAFIHKNRDSQEFVSRHRINLLTSHHISLPWLNQSISSKALKSKVNKTKALKDSIIIKKL